MDDNGLKFFLCVREKEVMDGLEFNLKKILFWSDTDTPLFWQPLTKGS